MKRIKRLVSVLFAVLFFMLSGAEVGGLDFEFHYMRDSSPSVISEWQARARADLYRAEGKDVYRGPDCDQTVVIDSRPRGGAR